MEETYQRLDTQDIQILLINKNREFTDAMKMGKKQKDLLPIFETIKVLYHELCSRRPEYIREHAA
jgi:hypothetical protein